MDDQNNANESHQLPLDFSPWNRGNTDESCPFVSMRLILHPGGQAVDFSNPEVLVGRHSNSDIRLRLPDVSRRHCRFVFNEQGWQVFDLQSLNGLYVNGQKVEKAVIKHKDMIRIGGFTFEVDMNPIVPSLPLPARNPRSSEKILESIEDALPQKRQAS